MIIGWGHDHITRGGGGGVGGGGGWGGDPQHWALHDSHGISTCMTEKAQGLLDWLKTFFYFPMTIA